MPELPDVVLYVESLDRLLTGMTIRDDRVRSPFVLRTFDPMIEEITGRQVSGFSRRGKRIVFHLDDGPYVTEIERLHQAVQETLATWIERLREQTGQNFPERVTTFRPEMAVHGKFNQPCPVCGSPVQRIRYADNQCNYCTGCQTDGRILSDRSLASASGTKKLCLRLQDFPF